MNNNKVKVLTSPNEFFIEDSCYGDVLVYCDCCGYGCGSGSGSFLGYGEGSGDGCAIKNHIK